MGKYDRKSPARGEAASASRAGAASIPRGSKGEIRDNPEYQRVAAYLSAVRFKRKAVGGLDPADVWKKLEELNGLYEDALLAERVRCNLLIRQVRMSGGALPEDADGEI